MANERSSFYRRVLEQLLDEGVLRRDMTVLVVAGGPADRDVFHELGFEHVTISNVDEEVAAEELAPYEWSFQDAEALTYADGSFDLTVVSAGLHHCRSPHRALLELYRVARVAALALESRDSALMRVAVKLGAVDEYELAAVAAHGLRSGGVANTSTPNYVYRWSEREVEKTVASFAPHARHRIRFFREFELPEALVEIDQGARASVLRLARPVVTGITRVLPRQANLFAFVIEKPQLPGDLQPWMRADGGELRPDPEVVGRRYGSSAIGLERHQAGLGPPGRGRCAVGGADRVRAARAGAGTWRSSSPPARPRSRTSARSPRRSDGRRAAQRALDFGCGVGRLTRALGMRFESAFGVDISAGMVEQAQTAERGVPGLRVPGQRRARPRPAGDGLVRLRLLEHRAQHIATVPEIERYVTRLSARGPAGRARRLRAAVPHPVALVVPAAPARVRAAAAARGLGAVDAAPDAADADADDARCPRRRCAG